MSDQRPDYSGLSACFVNATLKPSPEHSHTRVLIDVSRDIMERAGVSTDVIRAVDHDIAPGVQPDMTAHGAASDEWPELWPRIIGADILVLAGPIWLGVNSSVMHRVIERLYAHSAERNDAGQYVFYGRAAGCLITGNEDGIKACASTVLYALGHIGYTIPPQADAGWIGEAGPGPSYGDDGAGFDNDFTNRNTTFMTWNLMHAAKALADAGGIPAYGNLPAEWSDGERFGFQNPEYR
jgi:multimeric flavodoxin WrbA